jgi:hypothetical protein
MFARLIRFLAHPRLVFWLFPWLMLLLTGGTIAQRSIGLYEAERQFFASWFFMLGPVPLPGMYPALVLLTLALIAKTLFKSPWQKNRIGIYITHLGALLLMGGGLLTALDSTEGYLALKEGETGMMVSDYHAREFVVIRDGEVVLSVPHHALHDDMRLGEAELPFALRMLNYCRNCAPVRQEEEDERRKSVAAQFELTDGPLAKEDEENQAGAMLEVTGAGDEDGIYATFEPIPHPPGITYDGHSYIFQMRRIQRELPFSVTLHSVQKFTHPGMDMAREYQSDITVNEPGGISWQRLIRMNEPLRVQGYTLYQASLADARGEVVSVLAVVENRGRIFPYLAGMVMAVGLGIHSVQRMRRRA